MKLRKFLLILLTNFLPLCPVYAAEKWSDRIKSLPGLTFQPNFKQYAGYLDASIGNHLHYWLVEAQSAPSSAPLLLWLNGGPGCSSLGGLLTENGPFRPTADGQHLIENVYSWNKIANVLYLESPRDIGFSYRESEKYGNDTLYNDDKTAIDNVLALADFFRAFPEYHGRAFFVTGESYGGVYIPTLVELLIQNIQNGSLAHVNLQGFAVGNGEMSLVDQIDSSIGLLYYRGMIGKDEYSALFECCPNAAKDGLAFCKFTDLVILDEFGRGVPKHFDDPKLQQCANTVALLGYSVWYGGNDVYNSYQDCYDDDKKPFYNQSSNRRNHFHSFSEYTRTATDNFTLPFGNYEEPFVDQGAKLNRHSTDALLSFQCYMDSATEAYLNQAAVRVALHVPEHVQPYQGCNMEINGKLYHQQHNDTSDVFDRIIKSGYRPLRMLLYNGDVDMACNFVGDQWFAERLANRNNLTVAKHRRAWSYTREARFASSSSGFAKTFTGQGGVEVHLVTVKGAGHYVPTDRPGPALQMISNFLHGLDYSNMLGLSRKPAALLPEFVNPPTPKRSRKEADRVYDLPGLSFEYPHRQYAGYLESEPGTYLHYWLVESQATPSSDPLVLWLGGGEPGCSSLASLLLENGPIHPNRDGTTLYENIYAWNKSVSSIMTIAGGKSLCPFAGSMPSKPHGANLLYIESLPAAGFSLQNTSQNPNEKWTDERTTNGVYLALLDFLSAFPEYISRPLYIAGNGYAGMIVPALASLIVDEKARGEASAVNLRGVIVGNGLLDAGTQLNAAIHYGYFHALYGKEDYDSLHDCCSADRSSPGWFEHCDFTPHISFNDQGVAHSRINGDLCGNLVASLGQKLLRTGGYDPSNLYDNCYEIPSNFIAQKEVINANFQLAGGPSGFVDQASLISHEHTDGQDGLPCWGTAAAENYLNLPEVQAALHVNEDTAKWLVCSDGASARNYSRTHESTAKFFRNIIDRKYPLKMLVFNGDVDASNSFLAAQWFVERLAADHNLSATQSRSTWRYLGAKGGHSKRFSGDATTIDLVTIKGAGMRAAADRPGPAAQMLNAFLTDSPSYSKASPYAARLSEQKLDYAVAEKASAGGRLPSVLQRTKHQNSRRGASRAKRSATDPRPPPPPPGSKTADRIRELPGLTFNFTSAQYSGYLSASRGNYLHYWLVEAAETPSTKPLVLWLNGGPGCSSLLGLVHELGPFLYNRDGGETLYENVFAWTKIANVLFLEGPVDVGFSYRSNEVPPDDHYTDDKTALDNALALAQFFERFPEYQTRPFFMTGESYGGVYLPTLTDILMGKILDGSVLANLQGVAIGNGIMSDMLQFNSAVSLAYFKGMTGEDDYNELKKCMPSEYRGPMAYFDWSSYLEIDLHGGLWPKNKNHSSMEYSCGMQLIYQGNDVYDDENAYNTFKDCYANPNPGGSRNVYSRQLRNWRSKRAVEGTPLASNPFADQAKRVSYFSTTPDGGFECFSNSHAYLNRKDVRAAIHIPENVPEWKSCASFHNHYDQQYRNDTTPVFRRISKHDFKVRFLFYNGDTDMVCQFLGDQWFTEKLAADFDLTAGKRTPWMYQQLAENKPVLGGFSQEFRNTIDPTGYLMVDLVTIRGSGHMVPVDRPGPMLQLIRNFISAAPYNTTLDAAGISLKRQELLPRYQIPPPQVSRRDADRVQQLPGLTFAYPHRQYSGYLQAAPGNKLFYWFLEAQTQEPGRAPVVLWLNGGPGCSSLTGALEENGPFRPNPDGRTLYENVYSWNKVANVLYIDSPRTIGFSYQDQKDNNDTNFNDDKTAADLSLALSDFFSVFDNFATNDFYVTGESYAGIYIPMLADLLIKEIQSGRRSLNFKGIAIGNGYVSNLLDLRSEPAFLYFHSGIDKSEYESLRECCPEGGEASRGFTFCSFDQYFFGEKPTMNETLFRICKERLTQYTSTFEFGRGTDAYNLYQDCYENAEVNPTGSAPALSMEQLRRLRNKRNRASSKRSDNRIQFYDALSPLDSVSTDASGGFQCYMDRAMEAFLRQASVRRALHVPDAVQRYEACSDIEYESNLTSSKQYFESMITSGYPLRMLFYTGDVDTVCPILQQQWMVEELAQQYGFGKSAHDPWTHRKRIAGYSRHFSGATTGNVTIDLLTVKGAGHFVPTDRPGPALQMVSNFLAGSVNFSRPIDVDLEPKPLLPRFQPTSNPTSSPSQTSNASKSTSDLKNMRVRPNANEISAPAKKKLKAEHARVKQTDNTSSDESRRSLLSVASVIALFVLLSS